MSNDIYDIYDVIILPPAPKWEKHSLTGYGKSFNNYFFIATDYYDIYNYDYLREAFSKV